MFNFIRGENPSPRQTSTDKTNDCAMKSERCALVRGSDPPSGHSVHKTAGDTWRVPARRQIQKLLGAAVWKTGDKKSRSLRWQKIDLFSGLGEERRMQLLDPWTADPPDIFEAVICIHWPCPTRSGLAVG